MKRWIRTIIHLGFWIIILLIIFNIWSIYPFGVKKYDFNPFISKEVWRRTGATLLLFIIPFYAFYLYFGNRILKRIKLKPTIGTILIFLILFGILVSIIKYPDHMMKLGALIPGFMLGCVISLIAGSIGASFKLLEEWLQNEKQKKELEKKNLETELKLLKSQINPHFLFNTLNNIDVLIEDDPPKASEFLKKLSEILRFMLFETQSEKIPINKELEYIKQYVDLQKIRTNNPDFVTIEIVVADDSRPIAPLLFIPFIENAFKYATNKKISNAIHIKLESTENKLYFKCANHFDSSITNQKNGMGNKLVQQRLQLLYPDNHKLNIHQEDDFYIVELEIELDDN